MNKLEYINNIAISQNATLIALTETHLDPNTLNAEIQMKGYTPFRSERPDRTHGGVIIYIDNNQPHSEITTYSDNHCSLCVVKLENQNLILATVYRPPDCPTDSFKQTLAIIEEAINKIDPAPDILILGDFNLI